MRSIAARQSVRKAEIKKMMAVMREHGIQPTGAEIRPDGTVRLLTTETDGERDGDQVFDAWWRQHGQKT